MKAPQTGRLLFMSAKRILSGLLLALLPLSAAAQPEPTVPIEKVVFFKSGVSYVEHRGRVQGTQTMTLRFQQEQMKDVLKSLVLQDQGGGQIGTIAYPSQDPLSRRLQRFQVDLSEPQGVGALVNQLRGTELTLVTAADSVTGRAVSAESRDGPNGEEQWFLNLYADGALRSVPLDRVQRVQFEDEQLQEEMQAALGAVGEARDTGEKPVQIRFEGSGSRRVRVGYVVKAPVWKTSYRLLLPDEKEGTGQLQGWAIVENQTDADWENVDLRLVSGRPVSFVQDLYTPTYVDRPVVAPTAGEPLQPTQHKEGSAPSAMEEETRPERGQAQSIDSPFEDPVGGGVTPPPKAARSSPIDPTQGISAAATAADEGAFFQYRVGNVSLPRHRSAMLPIVTEPIEVERLSIYDPSLHETHPMQGARLENTTGRHLAAGPITVFDDGSYGGDAQLTDTPPGDTRFVSYALNQDVQVDRRSQPMEQTIETGKIVQGVLQLSRRRVATSPYMLKNEGETDATVIVEDARPDGWSLVAPEPEERTLSTYRFRVTVDAGETETLVVKQEKRERETWRLTDANRDRLLAHAQKDALPSDVRDALQQAADLQQALTQAETELSRARERIQRLREEQERIRQNLKAVDANTDYRQRLLNKLTSTEDEIETVTSQIESLEAKTAKQQDRLSRYLQDLDVE
jgi:hypothetical protein